MALYKLRYENRFGTFEQMYSIKEMVEHKIKTLKKDWSWHTLTKVSEGYDL